MLWFPGVTLHSSLEVKGRLPAWPPSTGSGTHVPIHICKLRKANLHTFAMPVTEFIYFQYQHNPSGAITEVTCRYASPAKWGFVASGRASVGAVFPCETLHFQHPGGSHVSTPEARAPPCYRPAISLSAGGCLATPRPTIGFPIARPKVLRVRVTHAVGNEQRQECLQEMIVVSTGFF